MVGVFSVTWYFLLSWSSKTPVCTNIKLRHGSTGSEDLWPRLMVQPETSRYGCMKSSCVSEVFTNHLPFLSCKSPELEVMNPLSSGGFDLFLRWVHMHAPLLQCSGGLQCCLAAAPQHSLPLEGGWCLGSKLCSSPCFTCSSYRYKGPG